MQPISMDKERVSFNLSKLKKEGKVFELVVDPDKAIEFKQGGQVSIKDIVKAEKIFSDAKKGMLANENDEKKIFGTNEFEKIAETILKEGEIQLTAEYRKKILDDKRKKIINYIHMHAIDPKTGNPHPIKRIELAMEEGKVRIDEYKKVEKQIPKIIEKLRPIIPIKIENIILRISVPAEHAGKVFNDVQRQGEVMKQDWLSDGSLVCELKIPAGIQNDIIDVLNKTTHGEINIEKVKQQ